MASVGVAVEDREGVRRLLLDRPEKKNALTAAMYDVLAGAVASASSDDVGALLIAARGDAFTAGNDLRDFLERPPLGEGAPVFRFLLALARTDVPIVAAVRGAAVGIGTTMLLHCDLVYAAPSARFRLPFVDLALVPEAGSTLLLPRLVGRARAGAALFLGETIEPPDALVSGLLTQIVDDGELDGAAEAAARTIAAKPRGAVHATKRLLTHDRPAVIDAIRREAEVFAERLASAEARATMAAFFDKGAKA
jgi:enoyl-CoA hydratase/carnithine racemase